MNAKDQLLKAGMRVTTARLNILELMQDTQDGKVHLSAESIFQRLHESGNKISMATIYRVLSDLDTANLLKRHYFEGDAAVYEYNIGDHHDHTVCIGCQAVMEFCDPAIEAHINALCHRESFQVINHTLTLYGWCQACAPKENHTSSLDDPGNNISK